MDSWNRLVTAASGSFHEEDLVHLYWDTLRALCEHYNVSSPVDIALIELKWKSKQQQQQQAPQQQQSVQTTTATTHNGSTGPAHSHGQNSNLPSSVTTSPAASPERPAHPSSRHVDPGSTLSEHDISVQSARSVTATRIGRSETPGGVAPPGRHPWNYRGRSADAPRNREYIFAVRNGLLSPQRRAISRGRSTEAVPEDLRRHFDAFSSFGGGVAGEMDSAHCIKLFRDAGIINKTMASHDVDILFAKAKRKGQRKLSYAEFRQILVPDIAAKFGWSAGELVKRLLQCKGPVVVATKAEAVRWYDDKEGYTGTHRSVSASGRRESGTAFGRRDSMVSMS